ncbi:MAG: AAC(3) family N-acetyltransferase [Rhodospirillales bacterium]|jgi:aminoglycoside 3-N-acetyltransferase|nr:AAC(3) family N-acetyltransferase [Rhodospirillales bacterium]MDP6884364.1 AAC(3) family N-acetyltransferase [Rhodospirillales bacterium]
MAYTYAELLEAYEALGVSTGRTVYVTSDLTRLRQFEDKGKKAVLEAHHRALRFLIGDTGTIVVPTGTINLCNTDTVFDVDQTPSYQVGVFSEYLRQMPDARRSFHPFVSYAAIGPNAERIVNNVSRHAFGPETPEARMVDLDTLSVSVGLYPRYSCSTLHQVEQVMTVPYRYVKEYIHPVVRDGKVVHEPFYQYVWYRDADIERNYGKWIFPRFAEDHDVRRIEVGRGRIYSYSMREFVSAASRMMLEDPYIWCETPPTVRPWQE